MSGIGTGYDLSVTTYSPDGKIFQTEYAQKAVDNSSTVVGLKVKDGVVLGLEKPIISKLLVEGSNRRMYTVDKHAGIATAGLAPDGRMLVNRAMEEGAAYRRFYGDAIPGHVLAERVASYVHLYNLYWSVRPFGSSLLLAAMDSNGPQLYGIEPSGSYVRYFGTAVGKGRQSAKNEIEKLKLTEMTARQAVIEVAKILHKVHDDDGKPFDMEISWVCEESGSLHQRVPADIVAEAQRLAKAAAADSDMDD
mmetsp:Transcript_4078/g.6693  ORF Transcript_4078/g.6693 Transcript_4078/m.6693 type:complete len:250 (-) Transcript_4078:349-1098(-)|eukprot:CAMPEP_0119117054 /NCGR_PEP_ID=MMETSP1180-20130426/52627_1 /TAXON_ID=3052 ORGANISM="Chlamydomonas cf sp, Strain CCMP681" /NCGR_SAMPLE_ID=MMETSP1180 /ASSEMBLY_ACC=CAM_ASM_000741 /LENGTH=249 /DNA_ID=CAMNT_0007106271 /DNA_START=155 /DNA_END=904 /DNA_ORIENTATION=+